MVLSTNLGFPRIGARRELKRALESYWKGKSTERELRAVARELRQRHWILQRDSGIDHIPSGDFSLYDHVLDTATMVGAVPARFGPQLDDDDRGDVHELTTYFAMARGLQEKHGGREDGSTAGHDDSQGTPALEMTKWFDTNYHYLVPELTPDQEFSLCSTSPVDRFLEARELGIHTRPVLLGPVSFLLLAKSADDSFDRLSLLPALLPVYQELLRRLAEAGASWVQLDEPVLVLDLPAPARQAFDDAYRQLATAAPKLDLLLATYFGDLGDNLPLALRLPVAALHLDLVRAPAQLERALSQIPATMALSLGLIDGRNVWKADLQRAITTARRAIEALGESRVMIGPSCSLLHSPVDLDQESALSEEIRSWLAFATQKLREISLATAALRDGEQAVADELAANRAALAARATSPRIHDPAVQRRTSAITDAMLHRATPHGTRKHLQQQRLDLPALPTTTIGSFPQTPEVRRARAEHRRGKRPTEDYEGFLKEEIERTIRFQEEVGLDVLVHGESERNDMVEYFGERLQGFAFTKLGWVQSYGSRCVKPPIIYGDVARPEPMTVAWTRYAQSLTPRPVKGMLTGPVTILQWSFVRDDQPRAQTCRQIALAIRDEVSDLEGAGIHIIQIDEPALREGLPLRQRDHGAYLQWAVDAFRLASSSVADETQIHTHMCYAEFGEIIEAIGAMDADVIAFEASRSRMDLLPVFQEIRYPNDVGPGVYDIHSPRVPTRQEMESLLHKALGVLDPHQLWVNPDCGLKTRRWEEVRPALQRMVAAARAVRSV